MRRRDFIKVIGGGAAAWPLGARAQQPGSMRRIGVLMNFAADDPAAQARLTAFLQALQQLGWTNGGNVQIDIRWSAGDPERNRRYAAELVTLAPDIIFASTSLSVTSLQQATRVLPIVFVQVVDPVASGFIASLGKPGGNITGFTIYEYGMSAKWLEILKEIAPRVTRVWNRTRSCQHRRHRPVWRYPICGAVTRNAVEPNQLGQRQRDRTWH
jgi:putative ABC transport system substrate-binding protein